MKFLLMSTLGKSFVVDGGQHLRDDIIWVLFPFLKALPKFLLIGTLGEADVRCWRSALAMVVVVCVVRFSTEFPL